MNIEALVADPDSGLTIANIEGYVTLTATVSKGDVLPLNAGAIIASIPTTVGSAATATQRKSSSPCIALKSGVSGDRIPVLIAGRAQALVKSTTATAIAVGDRLNFGTGKAFELDAPAVNTNRWCAWSDEARAAGTTSIISLTGATWTESSKTITKTGAFASYVFSSGDTLTITGGTGATTGTYYVASRTSDDAVVLTASIGSGADGQTNIAGSLGHPLHWVVLAGPNGLGMQAYTNATGIGT